jgi:hypothetical protein
MSRMLPLLRPFREELFRKTVDLMMRAAEAKP